MRLLTRHRETVFATDPAALLPAVLGLKTPVLPLDLGSTENLLVSITCFLALSFYACSSLLPNGEIHFIPDTATPQS